MKRIFKQAVLAAVLIFLCTTAFAQKVGDSTTRLNEVNGTPKWEKCTVTSISEYEYDGQGRIISIKHEYSELGSYDVVYDRTDTGTFQYDSAGNIISCNLAFWGQQFEMGEPTFYDFNKTFTYNAKGDVASQNVNFTLTSGNEKYNGMREYKYDYDKNGNVTSIKAKINDKPEVTWPFAYKYNDKGEAEYVTSPDFGSFKLDNWHMELKGWKPVTCLHQEFFSAHFWPLTYRHPGIFTLNLTEYDQKGNKTGELISTDALGDPGFMYKLDTYGRPAHYMKIEGLLWGLGEAIKTWENYNSWDANYEYDAKGNISRNTQQGWPYAYSYEYEYDSYGKVKKEIMYIVKPM